MNTFTRRSLAAVLIGGWILSGAAEAVSPLEIQQGRQLFEKNWSPQNPALRSDGLGPLFNATSCVACHHQGGVGGGGEAPFNAHSVGIEEFEITGGDVSDDVIARMVTQFHPGFVASNGVVGNTLALPHHGGTPFFTASRKSLFDQLPAEFSSSGGPLNADEVRAGSSMPLLYSAHSGGYTMTLRARLFQRNTTALFGAGLIDQVRDEDLDRMVRVQQRHPEISGRPGTLRDGRYGKFGWRANVASLLEFNDQACANEMGLETKRLLQPADPTMRGYKNPREDISDEQIKMMTSFTAALPAPQQVLPSDPERLQAVRRGEQAFEAVGCAVCHVPSLGPATHVYSDLLLHDMGYELMDLNRAEPYIVRMTPVTQVSFAGQLSRSGTMTQTGYYGSGATMTSNVSSTSTVRRGARSAGSNARGTGGGRRLGRQRGYQFQAPTVPTETIEFVTLGHSDKQVSNSRRLTDDEISSDPLVTGDITETQSGTVRQTRYLRQHIERTNFNQEWRTPPLWGVADSAPYMHDGRAETLLEAIAMHDGEASGTRDRFLDLSVSDRRAVIAFLKTLVAPTNVPAASL
ncbi:hypothetical protein FYK55_04800 [Roseiconus nitratireducens]|uniref:Cytochrome c domain-containing protein n=1 Tax=Roseiconus nitratireducens TaxID=2605748 RepID=A0A5M6DIY9_9BACT|nr:di-heme oxidoredictase family protein [Roseiconus nitratireducens]KAA5546212.1 hypothetical protein FYK55_04800 [Roseiconus nitratireducens]